MRRAVTWLEGYRMLRAAGCDPIASALVAVVWVMRGDTITTVETENTQ